MLQAFPEKGHSMKYTALGHSGIEVSRISIGGMSFGEPDAANHEWTIGPEETEAVIRHAFDQGINYIDTANCYAHGTSEEYIGRALANTGIPRDEVVLQSKVFFNYGGLSKEAIEREIDGTLGRLGTDYLDVYMIHRFDYDTPIEETMEALDGLVRAGAPWARARCSPTSCTACRWSRSKTAGSSSPTCSATTICSIARTSAR